MSSTDEPEIIWLTELQMKIFMLRLLISSADLKEFETKLYSRALWRDHGICMDTMKTPRFSTLPRHTDLASPKITRLSTATSVLPFWRFGRSYCATDSFQS